MNEPAALREVITDASYLLDLATPDPLWLRTDVHAKPHYGAMLADAREEVCKGMNRCRYALLHAEIPRRPKVSWRGRTVPELSNDIAHLLRVRGLA